TSCIGVVFDGTGYGVDGAVWGGEFLLCKDTAYERCAHLNYVKLCGGDSAAKNAELVAYCYLSVAGEAVDNSEYSAIRSAITNNINTQQFSSMGRLFDAVSAVLKLKTENSFEGECAIALENSAADFEKSGREPYPLKFSVEYNDAGAKIDQIDLLKTIFLAAKSGADIGALALGFHRAIAEMVLAVCEYIRSGSGENAVALSGGVFANLLLTEDCACRLTNAGFNVCLNSAVPTNDGGISLGQAWLCRNI
ncbi:MAG: carbamoyltransferase HypF, partial [Eubacteriales bacterium]